jgi:1,2-diacylglycerol 3-beta-galactosyltransferase
MLVPVLECYSTCVKLALSHAVSRFPISVDACFVPSDALNEAARQRNLKPSQIVQYGLPIRKGFWSNMGSSQVESGSKEGLMSDFFGKKGVGASKGGSPKAALRDDLGLDTDLPTVLVVGGGDGMGGLVAISDELGKQLGKAGDGEPAFQLVIVCGNNKAARDELEEKSWGSGVKVSVQGFVNNMDEFMRASDALVTKAGPGTIAEASICGLPCMMFSYL